MSSATLKELANELQIRRGLFDTWRQIKSFPLPLSTAPVMLFDRAAVVTWVRENLRKESWPESKPLS